jgi:hypothetical protein
LYGLLDRSGDLLGNPVHYRDTRTEGVAIARRSLPADTAAVVSTYPLASQGGMRRRGLLDAPLITD